MPIKLQEGFPAKSALEKEDIFAIDNQRAVTQDIRPLKLIILNLMPNKIDTELQLLRLISRTSLQVDVDFLKMDTHVSKNTSMSHLQKYYENFDDIKNNKYDGLIITGAPLEHLRFDEVDYWDELKQVMEWSKTNVFSTVHICWGAQAGLYYHFGIDKVDYKNKLFGIYPNDLIANNFLVAGFDDIFNTPQSRWTGIDEKAVNTHKELLKLTSSKEIGSNIIISNDNKFIFVLGHLEYDGKTLSNEYHRDLDKGIDINLPYNYYPNDDASKKPKNTWRSHGNLFYRNWLNHVYQETPYDLNDL